ncbi:MAG: FtsW/RodA/SpoVE family cell cycle protein [Armatimonadota bacterium]
MASAIETTAPVKAVSWTSAFLHGRSLERTLLLWNLPLLLLAAWGASLAQRHPSEALMPALLALATVWGACLALHVALAATRFDGDQVILPVLSLILLIGGAYHLDLRGPASPGLTPELYIRSALTGIAVLALVTAGGKYFRRLSVLLEEKVWWRLAGDRPYYESIPFHALLLGGMALLALLLLIGGVRAENGALIQVQLPGGIRFTPSELIRLAVAFFLADYLGRNSRVLRSLREPLAGFWPLNRLQMERRTELVVVLATVLLYCLFFYAFRDFGPAAVIIVLTLSALYAATGRLLTPLLLGAGFALVIAIPTWKNLAFHTLRNRMEMWWSPWVTDFPNGDHQARILWAIASGGWTGMGVGTQNLPTYLPLARNDAAFAGVAATMGLWTGLALLGLFAALTWRGMLAARRAPTDRTRLLAFCLTSLLAFQAVWICGAMVRVFPFTGINVPFISTGLTNFIASALALGTIWNLSRPTRHVPDATEATPEVLRGITRLSRPITFSFALPAIGLILYGCPWILGDRILLQPAQSIGRAREKVVFQNPYLERYRRQFPRGRVFSADAKLLAVSNPNEDDLAAIRDESPAFARRVERSERQGGEGKRYYPLGDTMAQLVGWTTDGRFQAQSASVETSADPLLRGYQPDELPWYFRNRNNPVVRPPQPQDLQLTVRADLQELAAEKLSSAVKSWGSQPGTGGAAVVYDVTSGAVLAAVTLPTFNPNELTVERMERYADQHPRNGILTNKALSRDALYFPGSAFKILTAGAGMDEGIEGTVTCRNGRNAEPVTWEYEGKRWRRDVGKIADYGRGSHGSLGLADSMEYALTTSCNVFFAHLAARLGPERIHRAMENAELQHLPSPEELAEHLPYTGFGQIDARVSPLEMAMLAGAAGAARPGFSDSAAARPHWVQAVVTKDGRRPADGVPGAPISRPYQPFPREVAERLREMMVSVVESPSGTAHAAFFRGGAPRLPGITVGGKTGTAEFDKKVRDSRGRSRTVTGRHAWFVGFATSDHELQPRTLAFAVLVEDVRSGGTGGTICAPVAREIIDSILPKPGDAPPSFGDQMERFYRERLRPNLGPLGPAVDWLRERMGR